MAESFPQKTAVISFFTPGRRGIAKDTHIDYYGFCPKVFYIGIPDIDLKYLTDYGYTYETYIEDTEGLAEFIYSAYRDGFDIICQCDFGQSRSAACASAILEHFEGRGIDIFSDYRYYPNQVVYHRVFDALEKHLYNSAIDYIKTTPEHISVDGLQRALGIGFGMAKHIAEKLIRDKVIERKDSSEVKFILCKG